MDTRIIPNGAAMARPRSINTAIYCANCDCSMQEKLRERRKNSTNKTGVQEATGGRGLFRSADNLVRVFLLHRRFCADKAVRAPLIAASPPWERRTFQNSGKMRRSADRRHGSLLHANAVEIPAA